MRRGVVAALVAKPEGWRGMKTTHRQRLIRYQGRAVKVDAGLADLVLALWQRGFDTISCCENESGADVAWVAFRTLRDAKKFQRIIKGIRGIQLFVPRPEVIMAGIKAN